MNLAKSKVVLKKINNLYGGLELSEEISKIEKDLLLDYVKELYESVLDIPSKKGKKHKKSLGQSTKKAENAKTDFQSIPEAQVEIIKEKPSSKKEEKKVKKEPVLAEMDSTPSTNGQQKVVKEVSKAVHPIVSANAPADETPSEIEALFAPSVLNKSDYRFSQTAITDISKAMGINDRLLIINLLFSKDQQDFNYVTQKLNYFNTFSEASEYIKSSVAPKYDWSHVDKKDKAIEFIKLIKRKYAS